MTRMNTNEDNSVYIYIKKNKQKTKKKRHKSGERTRVDNKKPRKKNSQLS